MFLYEVINMEEIMDVLNELKIEEINAEFNTSTYFEETILI
jgi:hypothetical protein